MKKLCRIEILLLMLFMALLSVHSAMGKDVSDDTRKPLKISVNKMYSGTFEKKGDWDCYAFVSGGGTYTIEVYDLSGRTVEQYRNGEFEGITVRYSVYENFSPAAGSPPEYLMSTLYTTPFCPTLTGNTSKLQETIKTKSFKKNKLVGVLFIGDYKGKYKFKIKGKAASSGSSDSGSSGTKNDITTLTDSNTTITVKESFDYTGSEIEPAITVKCNGKTLKKGTDYTVSYSNNKEPGTSTIKVTGKGKYKGSVKTTFKIKKKEGKIYGLSFSADEKGKGDSLLMLDVLRGIHLKGYKLKQSNIKRKHQDVPDTDELLTTIKKTFASTTSNDISFIYLIGHGRPEGFKYGDGDGEYLPWIDLLNYIGKNVKGYVVLMTEACHSGAMVDIAPQSNVADRISILMAAAKDKTANDMGDFQLVAYLESGFSDAGLGSFTMGVAMGLGYPTHVMLSGAFEVIKGMDPLADSNENGKLTVKELFNYVKKYSYVRRTGQNPQMYSKNPNMVIYQR